MKKLNELIECEYEVEITGIKINSKEIEPGNLFVCTFMGTTDRHLYIDDAIKNGASAVIVKRDVGIKSVPIIKVSDPNLVLNDICDKFYDHPLDKLKVIGVTGTDGKTTTSTIIKTLIDDCAYIGTNGISYNNTLIASSNTTPDCDKLYSYFDLFVKNGIKVVAMEVSSEALMRGRVNGISFDSSIFTNISREHLNIHKTFENYVDSKCLLFRNTSGYSILNFDDEHFNIVSQSCLKYLTYGSKEECDLYFKDVRLYDDKTIFKIVYQNKEYEIVSPLLALFNVYNLCGALLCLLSLDYKIEDLIKNISKIEVSGRLNYLDFGQNFKVMVDYAHTPNGVLNIINYVNKIKQGKLYVMFGEPGERDKGKRPSKGYNVISNCDHAIITSQDPRSENPMDIAKDLLTDVKTSNYEIILDRKKAIEKVISLANENDFVLILGKGNESYQQFNNGTIHFNDIEEATKVIKKRIEEKTCI